jgi:hypothetical protein
MGERSFSNNRDFYAWVRRLGAISILITIWCLLVAREIVRNPALDLSEAGYVAGQSPFARLILATLVVIGCGLAIGRPLKSGSKAYAVRSFAVALWWLWISLEALAYSVDLSAFVFIQVAPLGNTMVWLACALAPLALKTLLRRLTGHAVMTVESNDVGETHHVLVLDGVILAGLTQAALSRFTWALTVKLRWLRLTKASALVRVIHVDHLLAEQNLNLQPINMLIAELQRTPVFATLELHCTTVAAFETLTAIYSSVTWVSVINVSSQHVE